MTNIPKERSVEEMLTEFEEFSVAVFGSYRDEEVSWLRQTLQSERQKREQELQKDREEERERILALAEDVEIFTAFGYDTTTVKMIDPAKIINNKTNGL